jgi:hypothetical protein
VKQIKEKRNLYFNRPPSRPHRTDHHSPWRGGWALARNQSCQLVKFGGRLKGIRSVEGRFGAFPVRKQIVITIQSVIQSTINNTARAREKQLSLGKKFQGHTKSS